MDSARPEALTGPANSSLLQDALTSVDAPDIISFGLQEVIDLESRKLAAKTMLLGKVMGDDGMSEHVSSAYRKWNDYLFLAVKAAMPSGTSYHIVHAENLVGLFICTLVKGPEYATLKDVAAATVKRGMGGRHGNKVRLLVLLRGRPWQDLKSVT